MHNRYTLTPLLMNVSNCNAPRMQTVAHARMEQQLYGSRSRSHAGQEEATQRVLCKAHRHGTGSNGSPSTSDSPARADGSSGSISPGAGSSLPGGVRGSSSPGAGHQQQGASNNGKKSGKSEYRIPNA